MTVFVRFVPGGEIIGRARILDPKPLYHEEGPEPDLHWRWHPVEYLNNEPIRGVYLLTSGSRLEGTTGVDWAHISGTRCDRPGA